ncbi:MAG: hypothetical protein KR126chlam1_00103 [Chlamydiae bacterium]|nr:hypothetical protein [Chlamydiota bacterium]
MKIPFVLLILISTLSLTGQEPEQNDQLYLSLNVDSGSRLELSDGSAYEIDPDDWIYTTYWITPFPVELGKSDDPNYPVRITNLTSGTSVNGKEISPKELLGETPRKKRPPKTQIQKPKKQP